MEQEGEGILIIRTFKNVDGFPNRMGTTTVYLTHNDFPRSLSSMSKGELEVLSKLSPYGKDNSYLGWKVPLELHNGNVYALVFWKGALLKLEDVPQRLNKKYYDKYRGKYRQEYEWTILKTVMLREIEYLDEEFRKEIRKKAKQ